MTIEREVAYNLAHLARITEIRARTGNEDLHPDHYDFRQALRDQVLAAMDECAEEHSMTKVLDRDLPALFRAIDPLAERLWLRRMGCES